jgi:hypothetical protein
MENITLKFDSPDPLNSIVKIEEPIEIEYYNIQMNGETGHTEFHHLNEQGGWEHYANLSPKIPYLVECMIGETILCSANEIFPLKVDGINRYDPIFPHPGLP